MGYRYAKLATMVSKLWWTVMLKPVQLLKASFLYAIEPSGRPTLFLNFHYDLTQSNCNMLVSSWPSSLLRCKLAQWYHLILCCIVYLLQSLYWALALVLGQALFVAQGFYWPYEMSQIQMVFFNSVKYVVPCHSGRYMPEFHLGGESHHHMSWPAFLI